MALDSGALRRILLDLQRRRMPTIVLVTGGYFRKKWQRQRTERALDRLMELRHAKGSDAVVEAADLYEKLRKFEVRDHIDASKDFISVTRTAGPHQMWCLRLTLHHAFPDGEPWCSILRDHEAVLRAGPIPQEESERLDLLVTPTVSMRERYGMEEEE